MGCYNTVLFKCPECGCVFGEQTKSGSCQSRDFDRKEVPVEDVAGMKDWVACDECHTIFDIVKPKTVKLKLKKR